MLLRPSAAATVVVLIAVLGTTSAFRKLCITGDNFITGLWMANNSYIDKMRHASEVRKFDCVTMPPNPTVIAVEAYNAKSWAGILSYETGNGAPYRDWKCAAAADVTDESWMTTTFDDSSWAAAKHFGLVWHRNRELAFVHEAKKHHAYSWIWTSQVHDKYKHVYCRLTLCQDNCKSCTQGGPGTCDPDMCLIGEGYDEVKEVPRCNNKCCLALHLYGSNTPDSVRHNASFTLTDGMSKKSTSQHLHWPGQLWKQKAPGHYMGVLDFGNCTLYNLDYRNWKNEAYIQATVINGVLNVDPAYTKALSIDFVFGGSGSYDPFISIVQLNGTSGAIKTLFNDRVSRFTGCLTGVNNGDVKLSEVSAKRWLRLP